ncbi:MAG: arsenate reductase family protein [Bacteroidales bacterium]|nr:arsenate reductase family protein [Bacteroidales bacterium]
MFKIYHNPRCKKSRAGLEYLKQKTENFEIVEYLKNPLTEENLKDLLMKLHLKPVEMVRIQEEIFRKQLKGKEFTDEEWNKIILENPKLLKRPVVESKYKAVWADPPEDMDVLFK